ncbi:MAG: DUF4365 domain-containing protein [Frankiaceae bacterium]|nr:DUF4365 domain-containing protein [Frankiaceae bacterium]MBV9871512.1 DUF4365 domain-containing protein [Frankiaceae bacterium]
MRRPSSAKVANTAVTVTKLAIEESLGWIFREQPTEDYGIDAQVEVVDGEDVRGRLLALQIKGGSSWFREPGPGGWWYRPDAAHVDYWTNHSLPVVIVLVDPDSRTCFWQIVDRDTLVPTSTGGWKVLVPAEQILDDAARTPLAEAADGEPYVLRIRELRLARPWMEMLRDGTRLVVDMEEWVNKSSGRGTISLGIDREDGEDPERLVAWQFLVGPRSYADAVSQLFAWADLDVHEETYEAAEYERFEGECSIWDEGDRFLTSTFEEWRAPLRAMGIRPYDNGAGEVDYFRLEMTLNELGRAFLLVDTFATDGNRQLTADS